jgi:cytochrome c oxidase subunit 4
MSDSHGHHDIASHVKVYILVFVALLVGTIITVLASFLDLGHVAYNIVLALFIASVKAFLVAGYFMHLMTERKMIYSILAATVFFFIGLMGLTIWAYFDYPKLLAN